MVMARYCTNCGHGCKDPDKFCSECGTEVGGRAGHAAALQQGHWECQTFTESLGGARFKGIEWPMNGSMPCAKPGVGMAGHIERIVDGLVGCVARDGWEPDELLTADSLWGKQCVNWKRAQPCLANYAEIDLISVRVRFKRWVVS
jgi:hypothetical protein